MSNPKYDWWPYVKAMIRRYPAMREAYGDLHSQFQMVDCSNMEWRDMNQIALEELPSTKQREYESVRRAIAITERYASGIERLAVIEKVFWQKGHKVEDAAMETSCTVQQANAWNREFIRLVALIYGLLDE